MSSKARLFASAALLLVTSSRSVHAAPPKTPEAQLNEFSTAVSRVAEKAVPSVVNISSTQTVERPHLDVPQNLEPFLSPFLEGKAQQKSLGSGVIIEKNGTVLTSSHVVQGASEIRVTLVDGRTLGAELVGTDPKSDVAVLKIDNPPKDLASIQFGDSNSLRLGEVVLAIGNPFGVGQTVTMGIVSAKGRANIGIVDYEDFIQTDAAINPGNSGGALVNLRGQLVGINMAILSQTGGYQGVGFAIPSNMAEPIMKSLVAEGRVVRGWLGVGVEDLTPELANALHVDPTHGIIVSQIARDAPAQRAGVRTGDVILELDGEPMASAAELRGRVARHRPGSKIEVKVLRDGHEETLHATLGELPGDAQTPEPSEPGS